MAYIEDGKVVIHAVHENDLEGVLKSIGLYDELKTGSGKCYFCDNQVNLENLGALIPVTLSDKKRKEIRYSCKAPLCTRKSFEYANEHNPNL